VPHVCAMASMDCAARTPPCHGALPATRRVQSPRQVSVSLINWGHCGARIFNPGSGVAIAVKRRGDFRAYLVC
jgi:hypothetical protein